MASIGPDLPAHLLAKRKREAADEESPPSNHPRLRSPSHSPDSDKRRRIAGPTLSISQTATIRSSSSPPDKSATPTRKVLGPSMPPASLDERPPQPAENSDSDSDDDYGPALPSAGAAHTDSQTIYNNTPQPSETYSNQGNMSTAASAQPKEQRPSWMTLPPTASELRNNFDPSRQRARGFNTSKAAGTAGSGSASGNGVAAQWTETPEEKRARLQRAVLGISDDATSGAHGSAAAAAASAASAARTTTSKRSEEGDVATAAAAAAAETKKRVQEYNDKYRGPSLMEQHQTQRTKGAAVTPGGEKKKQVVEEEDDPSKRAFDWEKDMNSVGKMSAVNKKEMMSRASDFGSRFSGGGYL